MLKVSLSVWAVMILLFFTSIAQAKPTIVVGSKIFTESYILGEIFAQLIEDAGEVNVERRLGMGGTGILVESLLNGAVDVYPEYTGTIAQTILKRPELKTFEAIQAALKTQGMVMGPRLGFNNTYALGIKKSYAQQHALKTISDLFQLPGVRAGFTHEFLKREDGYPGLKKHYHSHLRAPIALHHTLAYEALSQDKIDVTDIYSTDAKIQKFNLVALDDDRHFFPRYDAVPLVSQRFATQYPLSWRALKQLAQSLDEATMIQLNAQAELEGMNFTQIAQQFLSRSKQLHSPGNRWHGMLRWTKEHIILVTLSLSGAVLIAVPLGILASKLFWLGQFILLISGLIQTIPSLALLCFFIPFFGIGQTPALIALFVYSLLPIVRSTYLGMTSIERRLKDAAVVMGLNWWQRLYYIEFPLSVRSILSGIKTSAIINVGTATLAALIGAGGYGTPILTGLALNDLTMVWRGAIPAAIMALCMHGIFEVIDRMVIPYGLRLRERRQ